MKKFFPLLFISLVLFAGCSNNDDAKEDLMSTLDTIISQDENKTAYLYDMSFLAGDSAQKTTLDLVRENVVYQITQISDDTATIQFTSPDVEVMLQNGIAQGEATDAEQLLLSIDQALQGEFPTKEYEVTIEIEEIEGHWYVVPNDRLENALSGGLLDMYSKMLTQQIDQMEEADK